VNASLLDQFEIAVRARNAALAESLLPGLPEAEIKSILHRANVPGDTTVLVLLYAWRDGISQKVRFSPSDQSLFPGTGFGFMPLQVAVKHFAALRTAATDLEQITRDPTQISAGAGRYFPLFWDGATGYLAVDLTESLHGIVVIEFESQEPYRLGYKTFQEFIADGIHVNKTHDTLACFRSK
jgi:hypothetical protein